MTAKEVDQGIASERTRKLFDRLRLPGEQGVRAVNILRLLSDSGFRNDDTRLASVFSALAAVPDSASFDEEMFHDLVRTCMLILEKAAGAKLKIPQFRQFGNDVQSIFGQASDNRSGAIADYIPQLGRVEPEQFGLAICTIDGQRLTEGHAHTPFCIQSVSKPFNYCFALEEHGEETVHRHMGCEPSGVSFNELALNPQGKPHNPMINAGGIMSSALIKQGEPIADRFDHVTSMWTRLAGGCRPGFSNATYLSERATADRNFALGYSMRERQAFPEGADLIENLEFYFQCCSLETTADSLSVAAATLANGGLCPLTGEQVLSTDTVQRCLSLMLSCGMYDYSGEWAFRIGLPAKSGVSGVVLTVIPNVMGICTWSPRLDAQGNSVRGIEFNKGLVKRFNFHVYDALGESATTKIDPRHYDKDDELALLFDLFWAASEGDCEGILRLIVRGADPCGSDYDGRTPLHLAASEGQLEAARLLMSHSADPGALDRWKNSPSDDARREGHPELAEMLEQLIADPVAHS
ncbi:MAG: glutaminase A [Phycisphaerae bacterium]